MTDQTVIGCKLPAAPSSWTDDRARDDSSIKSELFRPGRMLHVGRTGTRIVPTALIGKVSSGLPLALIPKLRLLPGKGRIRNLVTWVPAPAVMCCGHLVKD